MKHSSLFRYYPFHTWACYALTDLMSIFCLSRLDHLGLDTYCKLCFTTIRSKTNLIYCFALTNTSSKLYISLHIKFDVLSIIGIDNEYAPGERY